MCVCVCVSVCVCVCVCVFVCVYVWRWGWGCLLVLCVLFLKGCCNLRTVDSTSIPRLFVLFVAPKANMDESILFWNV